MELGSYNNFLAQLGKCPILSSTITDTLLFMSANNIYSKNLSILYLYLLQWNLLSSDRQMSSVIWPQKSLRSRQSSLQKLQVLRHCEKICAYSQCYGDGAARSRAFLADVGADLPNLNLLKPKLNAFKAS